MMVDTGVRVNNLRVFVEVPPALSLAEAREAQAKAEAAAKVLCTIMLQVTPYIQETTK